jgi:hypothetical protein
MSFSHTLLEELQLPSGITMLGERTKRDFWRHEHNQAIFVQRWERRCKVFLRFPSPVVIRKGDSNASIRVWEKGMKRGELYDISLNPFLLRWQNDAASRSESKNRPVTRRSN